MKLSPRPYVFLAVASALLLLPVNGLLAASTNDVEASQSLTAELPTEVTLGAASQDQVVVATRKAVRRTPKLTVAIVRAAILSKSPSARRSTAGDRFKDVVDRSKESLCPPCSFVLGVARAAIQSNADVASAIIEEASSLCPGCASDLQALLTDPGLVLGGPEEFITGPFGFGVGLGPGLPSGGPSGGAGPPSGGILFLPPVSRPVTSVMNN